MMAWRQVGVGRRERNIKDDKNQKMASGLKYILGPAGDEEEFTITTHMVDTAAACCSANIGTKSMPQTRLLTSVITRDKHLRHNYRFDFLKHTSK